MVAQVVQLLPTSTDITEHTRHAITKNVFGLSTRSP